MSEETSQTETVSDVIETDTCLKTHKSTKDIQNRETSSKSCHDKENVKMIKKGLPNKTGAITSKKLAKKKADFHAAKSQAKSGIHAPEVLQCMFLITHNFCFLSLHAFHLAFKMQ